MSKDKQHTIKILIPPNYGLSYHERNINAQVHAGNRGYGYDRNINALEYAGNRGYDGVGPGGYGGYGTFLLSKRKQYLIFL